MSIVVVSPLMSSDSGSQTGCILESPEYSKNLDPGALKLCYPNQYRSIQVKDI